MTISPLPKKVAIITGGASGLGRAVGASLAASSDWSIHIFDLDQKRGQATAQELQATYHPVDVTSYASLSSAFSAVFTAEKRIDFVFANAGIVGMGEFYQRHETVGSEPPPPFSSRVVEINLLSVINTSYLAQHYFRLTPDDGHGPRSLVITASTGGIYGSKLAPTYAAAKFGCVGFMRSIAPQLWAADRIRVNVSFHLLLSRIRIV
jgi:NAD(P)-dependent dehydrogenase (short-subunit alcohol dehydrogenase family)